MATRTGPLSNAGLVAALEALVRSRNGAAEAQSS